MLESHSATTVASSPREIARRRRAYVWVAARAWVAIAFTTAGWERRASGSEVGEPKGEVEGEGEYVCECARTAAVPEVVAVVVGSPAGVGCGGGGTAVVSASRIPA